MNINGHRVYFGDASQHYALTQVIFNGREDDHSYSAAYFADASEHIVLAGDGITSWNRHERIISLATGAPSMDCVRLGFAGAQS